VVEFTNSKGEPSPDMAKCTITVRSVEEPTSERRRFQLVDADIDGVPIDGINLVTRVAAAKFALFERGEIYMGRSIENVAQKASQHFVYLDVGFWGDNLVQSGPAGDLRQRNFAIVHMALRCRIGRLV
jgi:hypothetical protein